MADNLLKSQAFKLKGRLYTFTVLQLLSRDRSLFEQQLVEIVAKAPRLFDRTPVVLDCSALEEGEIDLQSFCQCMRENHLLPVAVQGADPFLATLAQCQGLAVLNASSTHDKPLFEDQETIVEPIKTKLLTTPVRSGQQVVSKGGDLVITAAVSHGAELLADGNIHVYGALRGRALAGISGDKQARIFCQSLEAELVSIAGFYRLSDAIEPHAGPCQIYLQDDHIQIEPLC
ncbi:septum site-determining protein MinC [Legionella clemsonensis]|uniref:Probable septum site-determining protein MinC n=1 Tax=Legionella clemsonensis TaxID=1867846 RepID=A0A222P296_9GAMM|nr:septum site-determining protein MinC [Legionella clemsonensis]ASQ45957.1 Septum site-determining protein MinC [Legionella clemsonensis]